MTEKVFASHHEVVNRERALQMAQAAEDIGGIVVHITQNEGEEFKNRFPGKHVVREGDVRVLVSGTVDGTEGMSPLYKRVGEIEAQQYDQKAA